MQKIKAAFPVLAFALAAAWPLCARADFEIGTTGLTNGGTYGFAYGETDHLRSVGDDVQPYDVEATSSNPGVFQVGGLIGEGSVVVYYAYHDLVFAGVGSSNVTLTRRRRSDSVVVEQISVTINVTPAPLRITAGSASRGYGLPNPALLALYNGLANGDSAAVALTTPPTLTTTAAVGSGVGTYPVTASGAVANANYTLQPYVAGTLTINPAPLTITAGSAARSYGSPNPALGVGYGGLRNGDSAADALTTLPTVTTSAVAGSNAGAYPVTASGAVANANYTIQPYVAGTLNVLPVPLAITVNNATRTFSAANPAFSASYSGFVNGDTVASLAPPPAFSTAATPASPIGNYPVTASGAASPNYTIAYVAGTLAVVAAPAVTAVPLGGPWMVVALGALLGFTGVFNGWRRGYS